MFHIKIDQPGWEMFSDQLGSVMFKDGVSVRPVTEQEADRLGASMRIVKVDSDEQVGIAATIVNALALSGEAPVVADHSAKPEVAAEPEVELKYTKEALEAIAEKSGIKGIRKIAEEFDVKGVQITALIDGILEAQSKDA